MSDPSDAVEKVTAFITRASQQGTELLLFEHPHAGIQLPAGTVEEGETTQEAVVREASEETGLGALTVRSFLGCTEEKLPGERSIVRFFTRVYARPDTSSFDWAYLRRGISVSVKRREGNFHQIAYEEFDRVPDPRYVTMSITGWVPVEALCNRIRRHFFHLTFEGDSQTRWTVFSDHHPFQLFWAPVDALPLLIPPQDKWLQFMP